jgi:hypothetical protein
MQHLHQSTWDHTILYADRSLEDKQLFNETTFAKIQKFERGGLLNYNIHTLFYGENLLTVALS